MGFWLTGSAVGAAVGWSFGAGNHWATYAGWSTISGYFMGIVSLLVFCVLEQSWGRPGRD